MPLGNHIVFTRHSEDMLSERGIRREWVLEALRSPEVIERDPRHTDRWHAFRRIPQRQGRVLRVVYVIDGETFRVITQFLDRARR